MVQEMEYQRVIKFQCFFNIPNETLFVVWYQITKYDKSVGIILQVTFYSYIFRLSSFNRTSNLSRIRATSRLWDCRLIHYSYAAHHSTSTNYSDWRMYGMQGKFYSEQPRVFSISIYTNFTLNFVCQSQVFFLSDWIFRRAHESTWYTLWYIPFPHRADMLFDVNRKKVY